MAGVDYSSVYDYFPYGQLFDMEMREIIDGCNPDTNTNPWYFLARIFIKGRSPNPCFTSLRVLNLPLKRWAFRFKPIPATRLGAFEIYENYVNNSTLINDNIDIPLNLKGDVNADEVKWLNCFKLGTSGNVKRVKLNLTLEDREILLEGEFENVLADLKNKKNLYNTVADIPDIKELIQVYIEYDDKKRSTSSESGAPIQITSVNEILNPRFTEQRDSLDHNGVATVFITAKASERLNSNPKLSFFIPEGRIIRNWVAAGTVTSKSGRVITDADGVFDGLDGVSNPIFMLNPITGDTYPTSAHTATGFTSAGANTLEVGDPYALFYLNSSSYFPDIFVDLLTNPEGGLGGVMPTFDHIDFPSIVKARKFCVENELYWDGVITQQEAFSSWVSNQAPTSLLIPSRVNGKFGLLTEDPNQTPIAVFNDSNILKGSYSCSVLPLEERNINQISLTYTDGSQELKPPKTVTVMTRRAYRGNTPVIQEAVNYPCITTLEQAKKVATVVLNSKRKQHTSINFQTATPGLYLKPGDLIVVQHQSTNLMSELSGVLLEEIGTDEGVFRCSFSLKETKLTAENKATIFSLSRNELYKNLGVSLVDRDTNTLAFTGADIAKLKEGDPVVITLEKVENVIYRVQYISVNDSGIVQVSAINWSNDLHSQNGLFYCTDEGCVAGSDP